MLSIGALWDTTYQLGYPEECKYPVWPGFSQCKPYLSNVSEPGRLIKELFIGDCACEGMPIMHCKGLDVTESQTYETILTCKKTVSESCREAGLAFYDLWVKVPEKTDKCCLLEYKLHMKLASSCNQTLG